VSVIRPVVHIDVARRLGCGQCLMSCAQRALRRKTGQDLSHRDGWRMEPCAGGGLLPGGKARRDACVL